jgi:hypothetical protein
VLIKSKNSRRSLFNQSNYSLFLQSESDCCSPRFFALLIIIGPFPVRPVRFRSEKFIIAANINIGSAPAATPTQFSKRAMSRKSASDTRDPTQPTHNPLSVLAARGRPPDIHNDGTTIPSSILTSLDGRNRAATTR